MLLFLWLGLGLGLWSYTPEHLAHQASQHGWAGLRHCSLGLAPQVLSQPVGIVHVLRLAQIVGHPVFVGGELRGAH